MADWETIISQDGPAVWRTAHRLLGNHADADDCFQDTFLAAVSLTRYQSISHPRALLQRIATARALDRLRVRYRTGRRETGADKSDNLQARDPQPQQSAEAAELSEKLRVALAKIPPKQAQAFCLFYLEGLDYTRIAAQLNVSINGVGVLLHRARHRLRGLLSDEAVQQAPRSRK
jgi:RNA polymerase sigma-70 factor (ECF subfamily)